MFANQFVTKFSVQYVFTLIELKHISKYKVCLNGLLLK